MPYQLLPFMPKSMFLYCNIFLQNDKSRPILKLFGMSSCMVSPAIETMLFSLIAARKHLINIS